MLLFNQKIINVHVLTARCVGHTYGHMSIILSTQMIHLQMTDTVRQLFNVWHSLGLMLINSKH